MRLTLIAVAGPASAAVRFSDDGILDAKGLQRVRALATRAAGASRVLRSPMAAAAAAAESARLTGAELETALADRDYGAWTGQPISAVAAAEPDLFARWLDDPEAAPAGGESVNALVERARLWLDRLAGDERSAVAITHPPVIRACLAVAAGRPECWFAFDISYATRSILTRNGSRWRIALVNAPA